MIPFVKASGAGNDFIALVEPVPGDPDLPPERIRSWCRRGVSLGADGLFLLARTGPGRVRMTYFNRDGSAAELCVNGTRCAARLAFELGWGDGDRVTVGTGAGPVPARRTGPDEIALVLPAPAGEPERRSPSVEGRAWSEEGCAWSRKGGAWSRKGGAWSRKGGAWSGRLVDAGVPHFVLPWEGDLAEAPVAELGPLLRRHPDLGEAGANVDFVRFADRHRIEIRSFERGVEGETLACGSGVLAAVAAGLADGRLELPVAALTLGGFELRVSAPQGGAQVQAPRSGAQVQTPPGSAPAQAADDGGAVERRWELAGDARLVARGELLPGSAELPEPPAWG